MLDIIGLGYTATVCKQKLYSVSQPYKGFINYIIIRQVPNFNFRLDKTMSRGIPQNVMFIPHFGCDDVNGKTFIDRRACAGTDKFIHVIVEP